MSDVLNVIKYSCSELLFIFATASMHPSRLSPNQHSHDLCQKEVEVRSNLRIENVSLHFFDGDLEHSLQGLVHAAHLMVLRDTLRHEATTSYLSGSCTTTHRSPNRCITDSMIRCVERVHDILVATFLALRDHIRSTFTKTLFVRDRQ